ncbi:MAG TPA: MBL fold metallo-hydrolase [Anaerolineaceae bacterium]
MYITFNGAADSVTGSQYLLEVNGARLLLECGLFQGKRKDTYETNLNFRMPPDSIQAVILSHAHIDHSGNLPNLYKQGCTAPVYATPATADLADIMLRDSGHIQEADAAFINKKRMRRGEPPIQPLYTIEDGARVQQFFRGVNYGKPFEPIPGVTARLVDAGHILGSAAIVLDIEEKGRHFRFWFSGDIGRENLPLIADPTLPEAADFLMMESTYGDKPHRDPELAYQELREVVMRTAERGGKVIIPAFAVGRTQELVYSFNRMLAEGSLPSIPVYVDSPLAVNASQVFTRHPECFDGETMEFIRSGRHPALNFPQLTYIQTVEESKALNDLSGPLVIISASGMAETGRILHHLKNNIEDSRNTIVIVSWQAPDTLGRRLAERAPKVKIFGEEYKRRAEISTIGGLSAHAGQDMLLRYASNSRASLKKTFVVHGEPAVTTTLIGKMGEIGLNNIYDPQLHETVEL